MDLKKKLLKGKINQDKETLKEFRKKHHDKETYRLLKREAEDVG